MSYLSEFTLAKLLFPCAFCKLSSYSVWCGCSQTVHFNTFFFSCIRSYILQQCQTQKTFPPCMKQFDNYLSVIFALSIFLQRKMSVVQHAILLHTQRIRAAAGVCAGWRWQVLGGPRVWEWMSLPHPLGGRDLLSASWYFSFTAPDASKFHWILAISYQFAATFS